MAQVIIAIACAVRAAGEGINLAGFPQAITIAILLM